MRVFLLATLLATAAGPLAAAPYLALSFGTSIEEHDLNISNGTAGRRVVTGRDASSDQALAFGYRDAFRIGGRNFDAEIEVFERRNARFTAGSTSGPHPTTIKTTSTLIGAWTRVGGGEAWGLHAGAGVGARRSSYRMTGPGVDITATDRAPYAMVGLRALARVNRTSRAFAEARIHTRPPVRTNSSGIFGGPLEHESSGLTLRLGLQIDLGN